MGVRPARPLITQNTRFDPWKDPLGLIAAYRLARKRRRVFSWLWRGPWPWTTVVVSGHRTTYGAPFFKLNQLEPGDEIQVLLPFAALVYKVTRTMIVLPSRDRGGGAAGQLLTTREPLAPISGGAQRLQTHRSR